MKWRTVFAALSVLILAVALAGSAEAQGIGRGGSGRNRIDGTFKFLPIPYVNYSRSIGFQGGALPIALFNPVKADTVSPSSIAGGLGMYTSNKTWFVMGFGQLYLARDNWRVAGAAGTGTYNFQFFLDFLVNDWIPYSTDMTFGFVQVERRLYKLLYGGVSYIHMDYETSFDSLPEKPITETLNGMGLDLSLDMRDNVKYPRRGSETSARYFAFPSAFGNDTTSSKIRLIRDQYFPARGNRDVIAGRAFVGIGLGDPSFNQQFVVGQGRDIRGYTQGEYRGNYMLALQGEYRWNFRRRLGLVGFAGVATVFEAINKDDDGKLLPGVGTGFRITVDTETHFNVGMDVAVGLDDWGIYFRIGEAF